MATIVRVTTKTGDLLTCDSKCYNAKHPKCTCVCGGINHGVGLQEAKKNAIDRLHDIYRHAVQQHGFFTSVERHINSPPPYYRQEKLFT